MKNTFPAGHPVVGLIVVCCSLATVLWPSTSGWRHWSAEPPKRSAQEDPGEAIAGVVEALGFAQSVVGRPFEVCPRSPSDVAATATCGVGSTSRCPVNGGARLREVVGRRWVESVVMGVRLWQRLVVGELVPEPLVVEVLCRAAWMVPLVAGPAVAIDGWSTGAHVLLLEAKKVAGRSPELIGQVHAMAAELVGSGELDPDDAFAEALALPSM